ncbi:MAG TPA: aspartyl/asparaginyl beta-hydroxylase domain-containing protein [Solirubrobacteraceae bacterium]|nr:aspartyl/asparaginyl beta-hydroxylase domain-containing protein [Solirubrobacteraceae bacterium]
MGALHQNSGDEADPIASAVVDFLKTKGGHQMRHGAQRSLLDHLVETYAIVRRWHQPEWLTHAALLHSVYGTDRYRKQLLPLSCRGRVREMAGRRAERTAYLFSAVPRGPLLAGTYRWAPVPLDEDVAPTRDELDVLVLLHMANVAEQVRADDGSPGNWLTRVREWAELLIDSEAVVLPEFIARLAGFSEADERLARRAYRDSVASATSAERRTDRLALAASVCPVIAEPCVWQSYLAHRRRDANSATRWARCGVERLVGLGTAWDKRLRFEQWRELAETLADPEAGGKAGAAAGAGHPGELFEIVTDGSTRRTPARRRSLEPGRRGVRSISPPDPVAGARRFQRYIETLADGDGAASGAIYPDLPSQPWLDAAAFPLVAYLESHYDAIHRETMSLNPSSFHRESERIQRSGDWDVAFFYERGRRRGEVCEACPVTTRGIEGHGAILTMAGLVYISRMRAGAHIRAHTGPTNLRVRCHLGIRVPDGDCAIRVGSDTRRWEEGKCLVFDDRFEHEAWNHSDQDRIVLIVDVWHPGLSSTEVSLLEGLHRYASSHARNLSRYWAANAAAARATD